MSTELPLKRRVYLGSKCAEVPLPPTLGSLFQHMQQHAFPSETIAGRKLYYLDKDQDNITVSSQEDYALALEEARSSSDFAFHLEESVPGANPSLVPECVRSEFVPAPESDKPGQPKENEGKVAEQKATDNDGEGEEDFECLACNGKGVNKKGTKCGKCAGTGKMSATWRAKIERMIERKVSKIVSTEVQRQTSQFFSSIKLDSVIRASQVPALAPSPAIPASVFPPKQTKVRAAAVDPNVPRIKCKGCSMDLTNEIRCKCMVCPDYSLCDVCEPLLCHPHELVKVSANGERIEPPACSGIPIIPLSNYPFPPPTNPVVQQPPQKMFLAPGEPVPQPSLMTFAPVPTPGHVSERADEANPEPEQEPQLIPAPKMTVAAELPPEEKKAGPLLSTFVPLEETASILVQSEAKDPRKPPSKHIKIRYENESSIERAIHPGEEFSKTWVFINDGKASWPANMEFVPLDENLMGATVQPVPAVESYKKCELTQRLIAPQNPGRYKQNFEIRYEGRRVVGSKVWVEVTVLDRPKLVVAPEEDKKMPEIVASPVSDMIVAESSYAPIPEKMAQVQAPVETKDPAGELPPKSQEKEKRAREVLENFKKEQEVPQEYEENLLKLIEQAENPEPDWYFTLLKSNHNKLEKVIDIIFA